MAMGPGDYLKRPYGRFVVPESDGTFRAEIIEFPGCIAVGDTAAEALANLENVAESWLEATIAKGQRVPDPIESAGFSGKLVVRLPKSLHKKAAHAAARDGVSLNQFIVSSISEQVGMRAIGYTTLGQPFAGLYGVSQLLTNMSSGGQGIFATAPSGGKPRFVTTSAISVWHHGPEFIGARS
jgi:predicted RNase H-like HicB family nuclease